MSGKILFEVEPLDRDDGDDGRTLAGTMEFLPGLTVCAYLSPEDGALVVQIDTPADGPGEDQWERLRVYCNEAGVGSWVGAVSAYGTGEEAAS